MYRLGRKQELRRRFKYCEHDVHAKFSDRRCDVFEVLALTYVDTVSIAGYIVVLGNTWEFSVVTSAFSLANGGAAGAIWTTILVCVGMMFGVLTMAEVASLAPTSGGELDLPGICSLDDLVLMV